MQHPATEVLVLEASMRTGGLVRTEHTPDGLLLEHGPDALFAFKPQAMEAVRELGLESELVTGTHGPRTAYVLRGRRLIALPAGMLGLSPRSAWGLVCSPLLSAGEKVRLLCEPFVPTRTLGAAVDESLADFVTRRMGRAFLEQIIEPLVAGIHGAAADRLSARAVMPQLVAMEQSYGSIARAMSGAKQRRREGAAIVSLRRGMQSLITRLDDELTAKLTVGVPVQGIERLRGGRFKLELGMRGSLEADAVVLASNAATASKLCERVSPVLSEQLGAIEHTGYASVHLAFRSAELEHLPEGTGFVVPLREQRRLKACTWVTQKWPERAPQGVTLFRCFLHGPYDNRAELAGVALSEIKELMAIDAEPVLSHVVMRKRALPCYTLGHPERVARMEAAMAEDGAFALAGNFLHGIGLSDCIASGQRAARKLLSAAQPAEPRGLPQACP